MAQDNQCIMKNSTSEKDYERIDALTGLLTPQSIIQALVLVGDTDEVVSVLFVDIDNFSMVNSQHGHAVGDSLLQALSNMLSDQVQEKHLIGRLDDEFVIILLGNDQYTACRIAEEIRAKIEASVFEVVDDVKLRITASIGLAALQSNCARETDLALLKADRALFEAKRSGGNRVCVSSNFEDFTDEICAN